MWEGHKESSGGVCKAARSGWRWIINSVGGVYCPQEVACSV